MIRKIFTNVFYINLTNSQGNLSIVLLQDSILIENQSNLYIFHEYFVKDQTSFHKNYFF
jgi:hypothetical protein